MDLRTFIFTARTTAARIARDIGVTPTHLGSVARGQTKPSKRLAMDIERYTKGIVTASEMLEPWKEEDSLKKFIEENAKKEAIA